MSKKKCKICGCTEDNACVDESRNPPLNCRWIDRNRKDLCNFCAEKHGLKCSLKNKERILIGGKIYMIEHTAGKEPKLRRIRIVVQRPRNRRIL